MSTTLLHKDILELLNILILNFKNHYKYTCDNISLIRADKIKYISDNNDNKKLTIPFHPLTNLKESCSHLLIDDSLHFYLKNLTLNIFKKVITTKDGTIVTYITNAFDTPQLDNLSNPTKNTKFKFYNLFNIVSATSFSKNLISFEIDFTNSPKNAKINFKYPLYDMLSTIQNNTIFGIHLEDDEIKLFKQIYENYIISTIDDLFKEPIEIPTQSDHYPQFYTLMTIKLMLEEFYWKNYDICFIFNFKKKIEKYKKMLSDLNHYSKYDEFTKFNYIYTQRDQNLDQEAYKNELQIRKESEPNWLLLKDNMMQGKQVATTNFSGENLDIEVITNSSDEETANNSVKSLINLISNPKEIEKYKKNITLIVDLNKKLLDSQSRVIRQQNNENIQYEQLLQNLYSWQKFVLDAINQQGICLWFNDETEKYYFRDGVDGKIQNGDKKKISKKITNALNNTIYNHINKFSYQSIDVAIEIRIVESVDEIFKTIEKYKDKSVLVIPILNNKITIINNEVFDTRIFSEFYKYSNTNNLIRNLFIYTPYLKKRQNQTSFSMTPYGWTDDYKYIINQNNMLESITFGNKQINADIIFKTPLFQNSLAENSFIEKFILTMVNDDQSACNYIINWLANYFQTLEKSSVALVLTGAKDITEEILIDKVIKAIFGRRYCVTINDEEFKTSNVGEIAKDTLFYHITDIPKKKTNFDDKTLDKLIRQLLINSIAEIKMKDGTYQEVQILGQTIITSDNPYSYIKNNESKCTIIQVSSLEEVKRKLDLDIVSIEENIKNDLDNFSDILAQYPVHKTFINHALKTSHLKKVKKNNEQMHIKEEQTSQKIDDFIQALKEQNINYFLKVKEDDDNTLYEDLENALLKDDGYYIVQYLSDYYNIIYDESFEQDDFIKILKAKDDIFKQQINTLDMINKSDEEINLFKGVSTKEFTTIKKLGKIKGYTLPKDLSVQKGFILKQVSKKNRFKYSYEDIEDAENLYEYLDKKHKEKKKK